MRLLIVCISALLLLLASYHPIASADEMPYGYFTVVDEKGEIIFETGRQVHVGDEFINEDNRLYEVISIDNLRAIAVQKAELSGDFGTDLVFPVQAAAGDPAAPLIAIYHTHTDESYIPTEGQASTPGKGSIMTVGAVLAQKLQEQGYRTIHSKTLHEPHDANAYHRSRRTFMKLLVNQPTVLFDVHRDSAPLREYLVRIDGENAAKMLLVVGRQNPNRYTTQNFARQIKAAVDAKYKGLIRGIFIAHGNYNQDISPRSMLLEIGTQYNSRISAERSVALFATTVPSFIKLPKKPAVANASQAGQADQGGGQTQPAAPAENVPEPPPATKDYAADIGTILAVLVVGAGVYLYLSTGSWQEMKKRINQFRKVEFTNFLGSLPRRRKK